MLAQIKPLFLTVVIAPVLFSLWTSYSLCTHKSCKPFSFKKGSNSQNHYSSDFHQSMKNLCLAKVGVPLPFNAIWKTQKNTLFSKNVLPKTQLWPLFLELASFAELAPILIIKLIKSILLVGVWSPWVHQVLQWLLMYIESRPLMLPPLVKIMKSYILIQNT